MAMTLRLTDEEAALLKAAAAENGVSMQEFARRAITEAARGWKRQREEFLTDFVRDNKGLLDRLGQ
jgi:uncharacterized protein (DUF1778 family)